MKTKTMIYVGVGLALVLSAMQARAKKVQEVAPVPQGTDWFSDMWSMYHGRDLSLDGENHVQDSLTAYGMGNAMGWSYNFDKPVSPIAHGTM